MASATVSCAASPGCSNAKTRMGAGRIASSPAPDFPNHFYLRYHLYAHYFPLMALGRFRTRLARTGMRRTDLSALSDEGDFDSRIDRLGRRNHARRGRRVFLIAFASSRWRLGTISNCSRIR